MPDKIDDLVNENKQQFGDPKTTKLEYHPKVTVYVKTIKSFFNPRRNSSTRKRGVAFCPIGTARKRHSHDKRIGGFLRHFRNSCDNRIDNLFHNYLQSLSV